jgi:Zn-finger nucleic acid-binding protein
MTSLICPKCHGEMRSYERNGVTVDQCQTCRGVYLDRGELEHLLDAENRFYGSPPQARPEQRRDDRGHDDRRYDDRGHDDRRYDDRRYDKPYKKRRKSLFEELFD